MPDDTAPKAQITSLTRVNARKFIKLYENSILAELKECNDNPHMPEGKFLELFSIEKKEMSARYKGFIAALVELTMGGTPNKQAISDGLEIIKGIVMISMNADAKAPSYAARGAVEQEYRERNEFLPQTRLTRRDRDNIEAESVKRLRMVGTIEQDAMRWKEAARKLVSIASDVGIDAQPYAQGLQLGQTPD